VSDPFAEEWKAASAKGAAAARRKRVPVVVACVAFAAAFAIVFFALGAAWAGADEAREREKREIVAHGGRVVELVPRGSTKESRQARSGVLLFALSAAAGVGAALLGFFATGGKLSDEHRRGLSSMR
jgi:hypothetical protein